MKDIKKYLIGFIVGLSIVIATSYAANSGSIGALFTKIQGSWFLSGSNIENGTISKNKLDSGVQSEINANTDKVGITPAQSSSIVANTENILINSGAIQDILNLNDINIVDKGYLGSNTNLNTIITTGYYYQSANAYAKVSNNYPVASAGLLKVYNNKNNFIYQTYQTHSTNGYYYRSKYSGSTNWYSWKKLSTGNHTVNTNTWRPKPQRTSTNVTEVIVGDGSRGTWTAKKYCAKGSYVCGMRVRIEAPIGSGDDTALNGVRLECCSF